MPIKPLKPKPTCGEVISSIIMLLIIGGIFYLIADPKAIQFVIPR